METYFDEKTAARVTMLTHDDAKDDLFYQTHPRFTPDMEFAVFNSDRSGGWKPHAANLNSGEIKPVVDLDTGNSVLARKTKHLYYMTGDGVFRVDVEAAFDKGSDPEKLADLPEEGASVGGITLDATEEVLYTGLAVPDEKVWRLASLTLSSGAWSSFAEVNFQAGHCQANPDMPGVLMFCHETGGDSPQRTWVVHSDGTNLRPFYKEDESVWVTHEAWWRGSRAIFTIWPGTPEQEALPYGICSYDLATDAFKLHCQYKAWHTQGSPDGEWIVGDDFQRNLWLISAASGERRLLTQGHNSAGLNTHPHPSFTPDSKAIVFNSSKYGKADIFVVDLPAWDSLPLPQESTDAV